MTTNIYEFKKAINKVQLKQLPYAYATALNNKAFQAMREAKKELKDSFVSPIVPYLHRNVLVWKADRKHGIDNMFARVGLENFGNKGEAVYDIMKPHIFGGERKMKRHEQRLGGWFYPSIHAPRDRYGNIPGSQYSKMLSDLQAQGPGGHNTKKKPKHYFSIKRGNEQMIMRKRTKAEAPKPFIVQGRKPMYSKRFDFYGSIKKTVEQNWKKNMAKAWDHAMRTAR